VCCKVPGPPSSSRGYRRRARALGLAFGIANIGTALGPFVGGDLANGPGWRWIFWVLAPLCVLALLAAFDSVGDSRDRTAPRRLGVAGAVVVAAGVALLSIAVDRGGAWGWGSLQTIVAFVLAGLLLAAFIVLEPRVRVPLFDLALFRNLPYVLCCAWARSPTSATR
jgi:hypothetical protein